MLSKFNALWLANYQARSTIFRMKIIKPPPKAEQRVVTLRIDEDVMVKIDDVAEKSELSRQALITAILKQVLNDPKFVLKVEG